jgi:hypothetical protein
MVDRFLEPGIFIMNRGMLLGIEQRTEGATRARSLAELSPSPAWSSRPSAWWPILFLAEGGHGRSS